MSLEFNNPLYIGDKDASMKADVAQLKQDVGDLSQLDTADKSSLVNALNEAMDSTLNGVNRDLTNLSDDGINELHTLTRPITAYSNNGELLTDAEGLADVKNYAHSTFDASKFTVVGSPNITDDGIASGFSLSNYLKSKYKIAEGYQKFDIKGSFTTPSSFTRANCPLTFGTQDKDGILLQYVYSTDVFRVNVGDGGEWIRIAEAEMNTSTKYYYRIVQDDIRCYVYLGKDKDNLQLINNETIARAYFGADNYAIIGSRLHIGAEQSWEGSIDLKEFSIISDGIEVFSGNKTGIDTIKPVNFTAMANNVANANPSLPFSNNGLTITEDGIVDGFSNVNLIQKDVDLNNKSFVIETPIYHYTQANTSTDQYLFQLGTYNNEMWITTRILKTGKISIGMQNDSTWITGGSTIDAVLGNTYQIKFVLNTEKAEIYLNTNNSGYVLINSVTNSSLYTFNNNRVFIGNAYVYATQPFLGTVDLNEMRIYANGDLIYQPCLKIPYTESKTGSKIVDSIYRDRVNDMANQFGYANYYTLQDEPKGNYQVVGSPTISSDFIASGFSSGQAIQAYSLNTSKPFLIKGLINYSASGEIQTILGVNSYGIAIIGVNGDSKLYLSLGTSTSSFDIGNIRTNTTLQTNTDYYYKFAWDGYQYTFDISTDNENFTNCATITSSSSIGNGTWDIVLGANQPTLGTNWSGSIDLNAFKIYVDNKLAYEAVTDPNFTLPQVELYGLINRQNFAPSDKYKDLTLGASGSTYTAPADGYFVLVKGATASGEFLRISNTTTQLGIMTSASSSSTLRGFVPVKKNDVIQTNYSASGTTDYFRFIYSVGSESEAN